MPGVLVDASVSLISANPRSDRLRCEHRTWCQRLDLRTCFDPVDYVCFALLATLRSLLCCRFDCCLLTTPPHPDTHPEAFPLPEGSYSEVFGPKRAVIQTSHMSLCRRQHGQALPQYEGEF